MAATSSQTDEDDAADSSAFVDVDNVEIVYNRQFLAVNGLSMAIDRGDIVSLMGPNGAGKSTVLKMISGIGQTERAEVTRGSITYDGIDITNTDPNRMVERGVTHILEGRRVFPDLTVEENLRCGLYRQGNRFRYDPADYEVAFEYFPQLQNILDRKAGYASGGEQQMIVISRALLHEPELLLLDEPSLGLAPQLVEDIFETLVEINQQEDITMIVADQNARKSLEISDYGYVMENGQVELHGTSDELVDREEVKEFYLGTSDSGQRYDEVRHYKIRKRWS